MDSQLQISVIRSEDLSAATQAAIDILCSAAFEEDWFLEALSGSTHLLGYNQNQLVSHAMWVTRWLQVGNGPLLRTAYVEGVATAEDYRARGFATAIMHRLAAEIVDFDLAALSPFSVAYYERLGWELWRGPLFIRTSERIIRTPRGGDVMVLRLPKTPELDLYAPLSAEWRAGELW